MASTTYSSDAFRYSRVSGSFIPSPAPPWTYGIYADAPG
jgi:hypothetical protein